MKKLNRFTTLPILIDLLERQKLILIEPSNWDDRNDTEILDVYKQKKKVEKLFALCFTYGDETIYHWKTFANDISGCCIEFDGQELIKIFNEKDGVSKRKIQYKTIEDSAAISIIDIPFTKRKQYDIEKEYRVIFEGTKDDFVVEIPFSLDLIKKITFGQSMPESVFKSVKKIIKSTYPDLKCKINRSTIYENRKWIENIKKVENTID
ncbi:hypothetical protein E0494_07135 [Marinilabiliaceae bacterium JC040]|nr:hypothetical protein [Marinilabiliaceae bacterium JC040]